MKVDYFKDSGDEVVYFKNVAAKDPRGRVLLSGGETITITLPTYEPVIDSGVTSVTLYNDKVCDNDLAERQRCGVLQMRAADLDDVGKGEGFRRQRRLERG